MIMFFRVVSDGRVVSTISKEYDTPPLANDPRLISDIYTSEGYGDLDPLRMARVHDWAPWVEAREVKPPWLDNQGS